MYETIYYEWSDNNLIKFASIYINIIKILVSNKKQIFSCMQTAISTIFSSNAFRNIA